MLLGLGFGISVLVFALCCIGVWLLVLVWGLSVLGFGFWLFGFGCWRLDVGFGFLVSGVVCCVSRFVI